MDFFTWFNKIFGGLNIFAALICLGFSLLFSYHNKNAEDDFFKKMPTVKIVAWSLFLVVFTMTNNTFLHFVGVRDIETMPSGVYCYKVSATNEKGVTYPLYAKIYIDDVPIGYDSENQTEKTKNMYCVSEIFFVNNTGHLHDDNPNYYKLTKTTGLEFQDQSGKEWSIDILEKSTHDRIKEDYNLYSFFETILNCAIMIYPLVMLVKFIKKTKRQMNNG